MQSRSFGLNNQEIVFVYEKDSYSITVKFINEKGDEIATPEILTAFYGDTYHAVTKDVVGYAVHSVDSETDVIIGAEDIEITFTYIPDGTQVKTLHASVEYRLGDTIQETMELSQTKQILENNEIAVSDIEEREYEGWIFDKLLLNGNTVEKIPSVMENGDILTFQYLKRDDPAVDEPVADDYAVTVRYVDEAGNEIAPRTILNNGYGNYYVTQPKTISGYRVAWSSNNKKGIIINKGMVVTYGYVSTK